MGSAANGRLSDTGPTNDGVIEKYQFRSGPPLSRGTVMRADPDVIRRLVREGHAGELHRMLLSISHYSRPESKPDVPYDFTKDPYLVTLVIHHVEFVAKHGPDVREAWNGEYMERGHPAEFERWLSLGMPHLCWADVDAYLQDHPLPASPTAG